MKMNIDIRVQVPEEYKELSLPFIERVMQVFRETYPLAESVYKPEYVSPVTISFWNDDGTPMDTRARMDKL